LLIERVAAYTSACADEVCVRTDGARMPYEKNYKKMNK